MRNDLNRFKLDWLFTVAIGVRTVIPTSIAMRLRELGYTEQIFSQTRASDFGRNRLRDEARIGVDVRRAYHDFSEFELH